MGKSDHVSQVGAMNITAKQLYQDALGLPDGERADLAAWLIESLEHDAEDGDTATWEAEVKRRIEELESGKVKGIPWPDARRMRRRAAKEPGCASHSGTVLRACRSRRR